MALIELQGIEMVYPMGEQVIRALMGINFTVNEGESVSLAGPSGSGKSTLLHIIGGLDRPTAGKAIVNGLNLTEASDRQLARYRNQEIGFVFQTFNLYPTYTAAENVALPLVFARVSAAERLRKAGELLEDVGLASRVAHLPNQLSGGERQRVAIARALATQPRIILADEPTGNLDSKSGEQVMAILMRLNREQGITLMLVTHNLDIANRTSRVISLRDGRIIEDRRTA